MVTDLVISYGSMAFGAGLIYLFIRCVRWYHVLGLALFLFGLAASSLCGYMLGWPLVEHLELSGTDWVFVPLLAGATVWSVFAFRIVSQLKRQTPA